MRYLCKTCGNPARSDGSEYADVCTQWPLCEPEEDE